MSAFSLELAEDEELLAVLYEHWVRFVPVLLFVVLLFIPLAWVVISGMVFRVSWGVWAAGCWVLFSIALLIVLWFRWHARAIVLTSRALIDVERDGFFHKSAFPVPYARMTDVIWKKQGLLGWVFGYGELIVTLCGPEEENNEGQCDRGSSCKECAEGGVVVLQYVPSVKTVYGAIRDFCSNGDQERS